MDNGLEYRLCVALADALSIPAVSSTDNFFELGGDSLSAVRLFERIESEFEVRLSVSTILDNSTVREIAQVVRDGGGESLLSRMYRYRRGDSDLKFFCAHGNLSHLFRYMRPEQAVYVLTPHGLDGFAVPGSVDDMATEYLAEIRAVQSRGPYYLGGYSFGGIIILEVAARLVQMGERIAFLGILDTNFERPAERYLTSRIAELDEIEKHLHDHGRIPQSLRMRYFPMAFWRAKLSHDSSAYAGTMTFFKAEENNSTDKYRDGCGDLEVENFRYYEVCGSHSSLLEEPHVKNLAALLQCCLDEAGIDPKKQQLGSDPSFL